MAEEHIGAEKEMIFPAFMACSGQSYTLFKAADEHDACHAIALIQLRLLFKERRG